MRFLIAAALMLTLAATPALAQVQGRPKIPVPLPEGRMLLIGGTGLATHFIALDQVRRSGRSVEGVLFTIFDPPLDIGGKSATHSANLTRFDCERRLSTEIGASAYDVAGAELLVMPAGEPQPLSGVNARAAQSLCGGMAGQPGYIVQGRNGAERIARQAREGVRAEEAQAAAAGAAAQP